MASSPTTTTPTETAKAAMFQLIDGRALAKAVREDIATRVRESNERGLPVRLDAILAGGDGGARLYAESQARTCAKVGIEYKLHTLPADASYDDVAGRVLLLNNDDDVHAIMLHLPVPKGVDTEKVQALIDVDKDVEGVNPANIGRVVYGRRSLIPCTAAAVLEMIESTGVELRGSTCVIVGASNIVGKPIAVLLMRQDATVISTNKFTPNLTELARNADVLVAAAGVPNLITADMVKPGAVVVDVGINQLEDKDGQSYTVGDIDFDAVKDVAGHLSPVPGGVGPMTVAMLLRNTVQSRERFA